MRALTLAMLLLLLAGTCPAATWTVEEDGSGDFDVLQDAIDAAAEGDSILVGAGRFDTFAAHTSSVDATEFAAIARVSVPDLTIVGAGRDQTTIGPASYMLTALGLPSHGVVFDGGADGGKLVGVRVENAWRGALVRASAAVVIAESDFHTQGSSGVAVAFNDGSMGCQAARCRVRGAFNRAFEVSTSSATLVGCDTDEVTDAFVGQDAVIARSKFLSTNAAVLTSSGTLEIHDTVLEAGGTSTIICNGAVNVFVRGSHIFTAGSLSVSVQSYAGAGVIDLRQNWWGTDDPLIVDGWIDDPFGVVQFDPIMESQIDAEVRSIGSLKGRFMQH